MIERIGIVVLILFVVSCTSALGGTTDQGPSKTDLLKTVVTEPSYPEHRCFGAGTAESQYSAKADKDQKYCLYKPEDLNREKLIGLLELIDGSGFVYPFKPMSLEEIESAWGEGRDGRLSTTSQPLSNSPRIFDLVAMGPDNQPKFFHVKVLFKNGVADQYTVDGPGIRVVNYKQIREEPHFRFDPRKAEELLGQSAVARARRKDFSKSCRSPIPDSR